MNAKTSITVSLIVLGILITGLAILTNQPPTVFHFTITIPAWLRAAGASALFGLIIFWLRSYLWHIAPAIEITRMWLADDTQPLLTDLLDRPAYTGRTTMLDADWQHRRDSGVR